MPLAKPSAAPSRFITLASFVLVVAVLRWAEDVMIPVALSLMLAFLLSPLVVRLRRWRLPKAIAIALTATIAFSIIGVVAWQITRQAVSLVKELPRYEENLQQKADAVKNPSATSSLTRAFVSLERMWSDLQRPAPAAAPAPPPKPGEPTPVPVEVKASDATSLAVGREVAAWIMRPLSTAGIVIVLVIVILFQREDLRNRFIRVISGGQLNMATEAVDDAAQRVSRYLFAQLLVNTFFGVVVGAGLYFIGVPHAALWGLLSTLLRFIPFLGPIIAVVFPLALAVAVDPGWTMLWWTVALYIVAELVTNNVIEVWVYGTSTGVSALALIMAAVFWSWLWGMPGLFLSTPLTVCLLVIGQYVPGLKFLSVLLGSEPPLDPAAQFYQRMLSMDQEEMFAMADAYIAQRSLAEFYDDVFLPALFMAEIDRHNGALAEVRQKFILESSRELIEELGLRTTANAEAPKPPPSTGDAPPQIFGLPSRDEADELVALMLAHILTERGLAVAVATTMAEPETHLARLRNPGATVFVSALPPSTLSSAGRVCRRVKQTNPSARVLVGVWSATAKFDYLKRRLDPAGVDGIALRLADAAAQLENLLRASPQPNVPSAETEHTETLERTETKLAATRPEDATDTVVRELARAFEIPAALVSIVEADRDFWRGKAPGHTETPFADITGRAEALTSDVPLAIADVGKDERFAAEPMLAKRGIRAFASAPLRARDGHLVGNLCVLDTQPRTFTEADQELLQSLAVQLMDAVDSAVPSTSAPPPSPTS